MFISIALAHLFAETEQVESPFDGDLYRKSGRFRDIPRALNYMHRCLSSFMTLEEKCMRYALLLAESAANGLPYEWNVTQIASLDAQHVNEQYQAIHVETMSSWYMSVTEKYRTSRLAPPFIEVIQCLERIRTPAVVNYLGNPELKVIVDLYRKVLGLPLVTNSLDDFDSSRFHPTFLQNLRNLFREQLDVESLFATSQARPCRHNIRTSFLLDSGSEDMSSSPQPRKRSKLKQSLWHRSYLERNLDRLRERSRLRQRRVRMLDPDRMREQNRLQKRRQRLRERCLLLGMKSDEGGGEVATQGDLRKGHGSTAQQAERQQLASKPGWQKPLDSSNMITEETGQQLHHEGVQHQQPSEQATSPSSMSVMLGPQSTEQVETPTPRPVRPLVNPLSSFPGFVPPPSFDDTPDLLDEPNQLPIRDLTRSHSTNSLDADDRSTYNYLADLGPSDSQDKPQNLFAELLASTPCEQRLTNETYDLDTVMQWISAPPSVETPPSDSQADFSQASPPNRNRDKR